MNSSIRTTGAALALAAACTHATATELAPRWEINLDGIAARNAGGWTVAAPAAEVFYQWSQRIQLTASSEWAISRPRAGASASALGSGIAGFKWLLAEDSAAAATLALWPQLERRLSSSSVRRGFASANRAYALPLEARFSARSIAVELTGGPTFIESEANQWNVKLKLSRRCLPGADCMVEMERNFTPGAAGQTGLLLGAEWQLNSTLALKTSVGRGFGAAADRADLVVLLGLKAIYD